MALGRSTLMSAISGNVGGTEYAMTKDGMIMKKRKPSKKMNSPAEIAARRTFQEWALRWSSLSPEQVRAWNAYAKTHPITDRLGGVKNVSGRNLFMKLRMPISPNYDPFVEVEPPLLTAQEYEVAGALFWAGGPYWYFALEVPPTADIEVDSVWIARFQSPSETHKPQSWIKVCSILNTIIWNNITTSIQSTCGDLCPGEHVAIKIVARAPDKWPAPPYIFWLTVDIEITAWWKMNDNWHTPTISDALMLNDATMIDPGGDPNTDAHIVAGHIVFAQYLDGVDDYIQLPDAITVPTLAAGTDFTIAFWWKPDSPAAGTAKNILSNFEVGSFGLAITTLNNNFYVVLTFVDGGDTHAYAVLAETPVDNIWYHFAVSRKGTTLNVYVNGISVGSETHAMNSLTLSVAGRHLLIGARPVPDRWSPGAVDDFRLYAHCLRPDEIAALAAM